MSAFGIKRILMAGGKEQARVPLRHGLRAIAVMDVKIHDRHPADAMNALRPARRHGDGIEQAETHRTIGLRMMAGRPDGAEGVALRIDKIHVICATCSVFKKPSYKAHGFPQKNLKTLQFFLDKFPNLSRIVAQSGMKWL